MQVTSELVYSSRTTKSLPLPSFFTMNAKNPEPNTAEAVILNKARNWCAVQERCEWELRTKLKFWGADTVYATKCIALLKSENYLDEVRFARLFAGGKFRMLKWGRIKIETELRKRKISAQAIRAGIAEIDEDAYLKTLQLLIRRKLTELKDEEPAIARQKAARFAISKGFETELAFRISGYNNEL